MVSKELAELVGIHIGDGCISINDRYFEYVVAGDLSEEKEYYDSHVVKLFNKNIFNPISGISLKPKAYESTGVYGFFCFKKEVVDFFLDLGMTPGSKLDLKIPKIFLVNEEISKSTLRGLFDTDGTIYFNKNYSVKKENRIHNQPRIKLGITSKKVAEQVCNKLRELRYHPYWKPPYKGKRDKNPVYSVMLQRRKDIKRFIEEIGFKNPKHYTKWEIYQKFGYCPPKTTLKQRYKLLQQDHNLYKTINRPFS